MPSASDRRVRGVVAAAFALLAAVQLARLARMAFGPEVYDADFRQEYCLARALADGAPPYQPLPILVARYVGPSGTVLPTSPNHPPPAALLALPFAAFRYEAAARLWLLLQLAALVWTGWALVRELGGTPAVATVASMAALAWSPVVLDLRFGNLYVVLLALLVGSWRAWRHERQLQAGVLLGLGTALKLVPGYLIVLLLVRREWRAAAAALGVCGGLGLAVTGLAGPSVWSGFAQSAAASMTIYQEQCFNVSLFGTLHRWLHGFADVAPLWAGIGDGWIAIAEAALLALPIALVARRVFPVRHPVSDLDWALCVTVCTLATPLAWHYAFTLLLLPIAIAARRIRAIRPLHVVVCLALAVPLELLAALARLFADGLGATPGAVVPGVAGLPYALPTLAGVAGVGVLAHARVLASRPSRPAIAVPVPDRRVA